MQVPKILEVIAVNDLTLQVKFADGSVKSFDVKPYLDCFEAFKQLNNPSLFNNVRVDTGGMGIVWNENIDLSRYDIWEYGK